MGSGSRPIPSKPKPPADAENLMRLSNLAIAAAPMLFVLLWSTGFIGARFGLHYIEPLTFLAVRMMFVVLVMTAIALVARARWPEIATAWRRARWCTGSISAACSSPSARAYRPVSRR